MILLIKDNDDDTEADNLIDVIYEADSDNDSFWIFRFNMNIYKLSCSNVKQSSLFVSLYVLHFTYKEIYESKSIYNTYVTNIYWFDSMRWIYFLMFMHQWQ